MEDFTFALALIIHSTIKSAINAVTKSAYATFHAPPEWWLEDGRTRTTLGAASSGSDSLCIGRLRDVGFGDGRNFGFPLDGDLHIEERGAQVDGHGAARVLYRQNGRRAAGKRHDGDAQHVEQLRLGLTQLFEARGHRAHYTVAEQDSQERPDQCRRHLLPDRIGRAADRLHGDDHPEHRRHHAQAGKRVGDGVQGGHRFLAASALHFDIEFHQLVEIRGRGQTDHQHAQRIADEVAGGQVFQKFRMIGKDAALGGVFHVIFEFHDAGALDKAKDLVEHAHVAQEHARGTGGGAEGRHATAEHSQHHRGRVGHHDNSGGGAAYDQQLRGLKEDVKIPAFEQISAEYRGEDCGYTDESVHGLTFSYRPIARIYEPVVPIGGTDLLGGLRTGVLNRFGGQTSAQRARGPPT